MTRGRAGALALDLAAPAIVIVAAGVALSRALDVTPDYDEGVYTASLAALRHGEELGRDVFASQPPGFYVLLRIAGALGGASLHDLRVPFLVVCLLGIAAAYAAGRTLAGPLAGFAAAALLAIAGPWVAQLGRVSADEPAVVLALTAVALAAAGLRAGGRSAAAALAGAALVAATLVKLFAATAIVPIVALALSNRAGRRQVVAAVVGALAVAVATAGAYGGVAGDLWRDAVTFHDDARSLDGSSLGSRLHRIVAALGWGTPFAWVVAAGAAAALAALVLRRPTRTWPLWSWLAAAAVELATQRPLFDHHLVLVAGPAALAGGVSLGAFLAAAPRPALVAAAAAVIAAAALVQQHRRLGQVTTGTPPTLAWAARELRVCTPPGARVVSDQPLVPVLADRRLAGELVDTSEVRLATGSLTAAEVERAPAAAAFVGRAFRTRPAIVVSFRRRLGPPRRFEDVSLYGCRR